MLASARMRIHVDDKQFVRSCLTAFRCFNILVGVCQPDVASSRFSRNTTDFLELVRKAPRPQGSPSVMDLTQSSISRIAAQARRREARIVVSEGSWKDGKYIGDVNKQGQPDGYGTKVSFAVLVERT